MLMTCQGSLSLSTFHSEKPLTFLQFPRCLRHFPRGVNKISIFFSLPFCCAVLCFVWLVAQIKDKANEKGEGWQGEWQGNPAHYATKYSCEFGLKTLWAAAQRILAHSHAPLGVAGRECGKGVWLVASGKSHNYQITFSTCVSGRKKQWHQATKAKTKRNEAQLKYFIVIKPRISPQAMA